MAWFCVGLWCGGAVGAITMGLLTEAANERERQQFVALVRKWMAQQPPQVPPTRLRWEA